MRRTARFPGFLATLAAAASVAVLSAQESRPVPMDANLFRDIARRQNPVVVAIMTTARVDVLLTEDEEIFRRFFGLPPQPESRVQRGIGSGFLIGLDGEILTNNHVVAGADVIEVGLLGNEAVTYRATLVGRDPVSDIAVIKMQRPPPNLPVARLGDSDALEPGDWVMAIGNPFQLGHSVTVGVVSYQGRPFEVQEGRWQKMIQTDAAINPGNSGGPLINVRGEVVGMNSAILGDGDGSSLGIGFAIPINGVKTLLPQLRLGKVTRGRLGVQLGRGPITGDDAAALALPRAAGAIVTAVERNSPAARSGLRAGDVIVWFNGAAVADADDLIPRISSTPPGSRAMVTIIRNGVEHMLEVIIDELAVESDTAAAPVGAPAPDLGLTLGEVTASIARQLELPPGLDGAIVLDIEADSAADRAALQQDDVVRSVNGHPVHRPADAAKAFRKVHAGSPAFLLIWRTGNEILVRVLKDTSATDGP